MTLAPNDPSKRINFRPNQDYPKYEKMMQHWENFVSGDPPPQVHLYWKEGLAEAKKRFPLGPKPTIEVRNLVRGIIEDSEIDIDLVMYKFWSASPEDPILRADVCETLPLAMVEAEETMRGELRYLEYGEGEAEAANGEETGQEVAVLRAPLI